MQSQPRSIGPYRIVGKLGRGGMGVVYRGEDHGGQPVAVKTVRLPHPGLLQGLRREIQALARIRHPGIVRILEEGVHEGLPWYAMELLEGSTLRHVCIELFEHTALTGPSLQHASAGGRPSRTRGAAPGWWTLVLERESQSTIPPSADRDSRAGLERLSHIQSRPTEGSGYAEPMDPDARMLDTIEASRAVTLAGSWLAPETGTSTGSGTAPQEPPRRKSSTEPVEEGSDSVASGSALPDAGAQRAPRHGLATGGRLVEVLTLVRRVCAPLAFLHGEGIVHRDLKPENVLVRTDGSPVLVDFGLVTPFGSGPASREELEAALVQGGTAAYMAPELVRGDLVDGRADLYALGCILYELLTGRPPFEAKDLLRRHLHEEPRRPSELVEEVSPQLDELVLRLLAKRPQDRLGHADTVAAVLAELGARNGGTATGPPARAVLYRPGFAGRQEELAWCREHFRRLERGQSGLALVGGESGVGKTRLAMELARQARQRKAQVLTGECVPGVASSELQVASELQSDSSLLPTPNSQLITRSESARAPRSAADRSPSFTGAPGPLSALRRVLQTLADRCREGGVEETRRLLGERGEVLALYEPALRGLPGQQAARPPVPLQPEAARLRLFEYLAQTLEALAAQKPMVLVLDDLQWADELTIGFLEFWSSWTQTRAQHEAPLLIVGTYRTEEVAVLLAAPMQKLIDAPGTARIALGRLDEASVGSMVGDMLALRPAPKALVSFLARHSEGNPFFVAEVLRAAVDETLLRRDARGRWQVAGAHPDAPEATEALFEALPLPRSLLELVSRRLAGLPEPIWALAEAAAVLGRESSVGLLRPMAGSPEEELHRALDELVRRQVLEEDEPGQLRFVHDKIREVAYRRIGPERRLVLHRGAAEAIETFYETERGEHLAELAEHWEQASAPARAQECYLAAARRATEHFAHGEAEQLYRAYLRLNEEPTENSVAVRNELGEKVLQVQGRNDDALAQHEKALEEARRIGARGQEGESLLASGFVRWSTAQFEQARPLFEQALAIFRQIGDRRCEGLSLGNLARVFHQQGQLEEAGRLYHEALVLHRQVGNKQAEGRVLNSLAILHREQGRLEEARPLYDQALTLHREVGDRQAEGNVVGNLAFLHHEQGRLEEARRLYDEALALHRQVGNRSSQGGVLGNLALLHHEQGRLEEARGLYEEAVALLRQVGNRRSEGITLANLGNLHEEQGRLEEAQRLYDEALALLRQVGDRRFEGETLGNLAHLHQEHGRLEEAQRLYDEALALLRQVGNRRGEGILLRNLADLERLRTGDLAQASVLAEQSERILTALDDRLELGKIVCCRGRIAVAGGTGSRPWLDRAQALVEESGSGPDSELGKSVSRLRRAVEAFEAGEHDRLFRGELIEDLPPGLRRRLVESGAADL